MMFHTQLDKTCQEEWGTVNKGSFAKFVGSFSERFKASLPAKSSLTKYSAQSLNVYVNHFSLPQILPKLVFAVSF